MRLAACDTARFLPGASSLRHFNGRLERQLRNRLALPSKRAYLVGSRVYVQKNSDRQPWRDRLPRHQDCAQNGHQDRRGLLRCRPGSAARGNGRRGRAHRSAARRAILSAHRQDRRRLQADRRRGRASRLRLSVRARSLPHRAAEGRHRLHRSQPQGDRRHGRQDRKQEGGRPGQGLDRSRLHGRDRRRQARREDRRRDRLSGDDQGLRRRRRQGHAHRLEPVGGRRRLHVLAQRSQGELRRRPDVHREVHRQPAPHRNSADRRQARQRHLPRRARMLDPAAQSEGHRGGAVAAAR